MLAMLLADDGERYVIPALDRAHVSEVDAGLFIDGIEVNPRGRGSTNIKSDDYPQLWFCRPISRPPAPDPAAAQLEGRRHAKAIRQDEANPSRLDRNIYPGHIAST